MSKIFSFDLGSGSIGLCVRDGKNVVQLDSLLLDSDFASIDTERAARRAYRTRNSHKNREKWWVKCFQEAKLAIPGTIAPQKNTSTFVPDERMLKEFSKEEVISNSALLRIALINNIPLKEWQVFKAVWSAIQHRGYDANIPWASDLREIKRKEAANETLNKKEEKIKNDFLAEEKASKLYIETLKKHLPDQYHLPCYYEASRIGVWSPSNTKLTGKVLGAAPLNARNKEGKDQLVIPRSFVEKEVILLLTNAKKQYPSLPDINYILYGTPGEKYASFLNPENRKYEPEGILGQKIPRFDNRIINKCCCISNLNVCNADDALNLEVCFLLALLNMRFTYGQKTTAQLEPEQLTQIFNDYQKFIDKNKAGQVLVKQADWKREINAYGGTVNETQKSIPQPNSAGRSKFCRPALKILKDLILSGKNPHDYYKEVTMGITNTNNKKGLIKEDYDFLLEMSNSWYKIHIPDMRNQEKLLSPQEANKRIEEILSDITNHVVRHRLTMFLRSLHSLRDKYGTPDQLIVEVARDEFLNPDKKKDYEKIQKANKERRDQAISDLKGPITGDNIIKMMLFREQNGIDIYDTSAHNKLTIEDFDNYDIDHIVPVSIGGSDSTINKVLTKRELNQTKKRNQTPYEWLFKKASKETWLKFIENIETAYKSNKSHLSKKIDLLTSDNALELEQNRNDLQATMYIEKLAQRVAALYFGWGQQTKGDERKVYVCNGGLTAKIRGQYGLNRLLQKDLSKDEFLDLLNNGKLDAKNRENKRHHALDALVISFASELDKDDKGKAVLPEYATPPFFEEALRKVFPKYIRKKAPALRETIYALRSRLEDGVETYYMISRFNTDIKKLLGKVSDARKEVKKIFDLKTQRDFTAKLAQQPTQEEWTAFLDNYRVGGQTPIYKISMIMSSAFDKKEVFNEDGSLKNIIGEYKEMGKVAGQYLKRKEDNKGQILYKDSKNKWKTEQIYPFDSTIKKMKEAKEKHGKVLFLSSGDTLLLREPLSGREIYQEETKTIVEFPVRGITKTREKITGKPKRRATTIPVGKYKLNTISSDVKISSLSSGKKYAISLQKLLEEGKAIKERV